MVQPRAKRCERQGIPKALLPFWKSLANRLPVVRELDETLTRAHVATIKGVAVIDDLVFTGAWDSHGKLWHVESAELLHIMSGHSQDIIGVCGSKSRLGSTRFFSAADCVRCWDPHTGRCVAVFGSGTYYTVLATHQHVFCCSAKGTIEMYEYGEKVEEGGTFVDGVLVDEVKVSTPFKLLSGHQQGGMGLDVSLADNMLVSASLDKTARVWNLETGACVHTLTGHSNQLRDVCLYIEEALPFATADAEEGGDGGRRVHVLTAARDNTIMQWDARTGERLRVLVGHSDAVRALVIVNQTLFSASSDQTVRQWDLKTGREIMKFSGHEGEVYGIAAAHGSLFTCSADRKTKRWDLGAGRELVLVPSQEYRAVEAHELLWPVLSLLVLGLQARARAGSCATRTAPAACFAAHRTAHRAPPRRACSRACAALRRGAPAPPRHRVRALGRPAAGALLHTLGAVPVAGRDAARAHPHAAARALARRVRLAPAAPLLHLLLVQVGADGRALRRLCRPLSVGRADRPELPGGPGARAAGDAERRRVSGEHAGGRGGWAGLLDRAPALAGRGRVQGARLTSCTRSTARAVRTAATDRPRSKRCGTSARVCARRARAHASGPDRRRGADARAQGSVGTCGGREARARPASRRVARRARARDPRRPP